MRPFTLVALGAFALSVMACSGDHSHDDASDNDASMMDGSNDGAVQMTASGILDSMCSSAIDLNAMGMLSGDTVTVHGSTAMPSDVIQGPCNPALTGHQVYRYRVRGNNVWLRATTNLPGGTEELDTSIWVLASPCGANAQVLACNDDDPSAPDPQAGTSTLATPSFPQGTEVFIVVASYARAHRGAPTRGEFNLAVTESASAAAGAMCDSTVPGGCVHGYECAATSPMGGVCVQPSNEQEHNDAPASAQSLGMLTGPMAVHAAIDPAGDVDCFSVQLAAGTNLFVEANDGGGGCGADLRAELYRAGEAESFDGDDDSGRMSNFACPRVDPSDHEDLRAMTAGVYIVCVRASEPADSPPTVTLAHYSVQIAPVQWP
jgi:hypothetical protein